MLVSSRRSATSTRPPSMRMFMNGSQVWTRRRAPVGTVGSGIYGFRTGGFRLSEGRLVFVEEALDRQSPEVGQRRPQLFVIPVPPRQPLQACRDGRGKPLANDPGRIARDDRVGSDVLGHHRAGGDHGAGADRAAGQDDRAVPDPDVVADDNRKGAPPGEEFRFVLFALKVGARTISEM